ncbi:unnamed protein product [Triticum turgidum subsp. durum]|uniref:FLZ-type domain-containing protein n=1 Tax=Triticum turgidum subsp. durum TaxID=4567 RepID=A0A9R1QNB9_TRITD|nr:unnamed protein product [Triticum turgidum subsp. durum]
MDNCADQNLAQRSIGFFRVPGLFVRLSSKGLNAVDPDSVWSPTSPLDFKNLPSSNTVGTNLKPTGLLGIEADLLKLRTGSQRVGLGLVDALTADEGSLHFGGKNSFLESIKPFLDLGLPKAAADASSCQKTGSVGHGDAMNENTGFVQCDCEDEEYTCVIEHGPNPRTTHILKGQTVEVPNGVRSKRPIFTIEPIEEQSWPSMPAGGAASGSCSYCRKRLREDMDTFMYLGEKAFCSNECRKCCIEEEMDEVEVELMMLDSGGSSADLHW